MVINIGEVLEWLGVILGIIFFGGGFGMLVVRAFRHTEEIAEDGGEE
jgi:hypothetical protein